MRPWLGVKNQLSIIPDLFSRPVISWRDHYQSNLTLRSWTEWKWMLLLPRDIDGGSVFGLVNSIEKRLASRFSSVYCSASMFQRQWYMLEVHGSCWCSRPWFISEVFLAALKTSDPPTVLHEDVPRRCSIHRFEFLVDFHGTVSEFHACKKVKPRLFFFRFHDFRHTFLCESVWFMWRHHNHMMEIHL